MTHSGTEDYTTNDYILIYRDRGRRWRWHMCAGNHQIIDNPGQSFSRKWNAKRSARRVHPNTRIISEGVF